MSTNLYLVSYDIYNVSDESYPYLNRLINEFIGYADSVQVTSNVWYVESVDNAAVIRDKILKKFKKVTKKMYEKAAEIAICVQMVDPDQWATNIGVVGRWMKENEKQLELQNSDSNKVGVV